MTLELNCKEETIIMLNLFKTTIKYFNNIYVKLLIVSLSVLLTFAPNNYVLLKEYQNRTNAPQNYVDTIKAAIQNKDVQSLEGLMCKNIKENTKDLSGKIKISTTR